MIPCYRSARTIERAVESVAAQEWKPAELILVDDASPDETPAVLAGAVRRYAPDWIRVVRRPTNGGPGASRNDGWNLATQPFVAFLDSDDAWHPAKTRVQLELMLERPDVAVSSVMRVPAGGRSAGVDPSAAAVREVTFEELLYKNRLVTSASILRRSVPYRFPDHRRLCEDYQLFLAILSSGARAVVIEAPLAFCYERPYASSLSGQLWAMERSQLQVYCELWRGRRISWPRLASCWAFSLAKYLRRLAVTRWDRMAARR